MVVITHTSPIDVIRDARRATTLPSSRLTRICGVIRPVQTTASRLPRWYDDVRREIPPRCDAATAHRRLPFRAMVELWRRWGDWALAIVTVTVGELEFWLGAPADADITANGIPTAILFAAIAVMLIWRRRRPALVVATATACFLGGGLFVQSRVDSGPVAFFLAMLVVYYSAGAWGQDRRTVLTTAAAFTAMVVLDATRGVFDVNGPRQPVAWVGFVVVWLVGGEIGRRRGDVVHLRARASQLERDREERARLAVEDERGRIARELHDVVAHSVSVMVVQAQAGPRLLDDPDRVKESFHSIERTGREALTELRRMLGILRTNGERAEAGPQPGLRLLDGLVAQVRDAGLTVDCVVEGDARPLPVGVDLSAYRIVQEALTNTIKHARGRHARVALRYGVSWLDIEVVDDGSGGSATSGDGTGHGLIGIRERVALYGGELSTGRGKEGGYAVHARLPLNGAVS
jgi:signal transduction histidine kinase